MAAASIDRKLRVIRGTLSTFQADVLVNVIASNSRNLAECGAVSHSFVLAGGKRLQQYFDAETTPVEFGEDVAVTRSSGNLQAKYIYHAAVRNYRDQHSEKLMYNTICKCLTLAMAAEQNSIAFPTVGCGKLGYKPTFVAQCFVRAARDTRCTLQVYIVAFDDDTFNSFSSVIESKCVSGPMSSTVRSTRDPIKSELGVYIRGIFPRISDDELHKLTDHFVSLGIDEPADMRMLKESDLTEFVKPVRIRILLDRIAALPTQQLKAKSQMTILLLGETGVGKSTTINSFAIYQRCATLTEAEGMNEHDLFLIPLQFSEINSLTYTTHHITVGQKRDTNEFHDKTGESVTQDPKIHTLKLPGATINIIDTPGIGDTGGIEKDKENVQKILKCLTDFEQIDAICLLLKPNQARLEDRFKYCLTEILRYLHASATKNIVTCFTNGKAVNFKPGDTVGILKEFLSKDEILQRIEISPRTVYYLENEPVRYLAKLKNGATVNSDERHSASDCWKKSAHQVKQLIDHISGLDAHDVVDMISISDARRAIQNIAPILIDVTQRIVNSVNGCSDQRQSYITEKDQMMETCAKLSVFLQQNSMMRSDETNDFLHYLVPEIDSIKEKTALNTETREFIADIDQLKDEYERKRDAIAQQMIQCSAVDVNLLIGELFKLPVMGRELQKALAAEKS